MSEYKTKAQLDLLIDRALKAPDIKEGMQNANLDRQRFADLFANGTSAQFCKQFVD